jgi:hypothetical protein
MTAAETFKLRTILWARTPDPEMGLSSLINKRRQSCSGIWSRPWRRLLCSSQSIHKSSGDNTDVPIFAGKSNSHSDKLQFRKEPPIFLEFFWQNESISRCLDGRLKSVFIGSTWAPFSHPLPYVCFYEKIFSLFSDYTADHSGRAKAWTVFARLNTEIVDSNPTQDMDVCLRLFCVCVVRCR